MSEFINPDDIEEFDEGEEISSPDPLEEKVELPEGGVFTFGEAHLGSFGSLLKAKAQVDDKSIEAQLVQDVEAHSEEIQQQIREEQEKREAERRKAEAEQRRRELEDQLVAIHGQKALVAERRGYLLGHLSATLLGMIQTGRDSISLEEARLRSSFEAQERSDHEGWDRFTEGASTLGSNWFRIKMRGFTTPITPAEFEQQASAFDRRIIELTLERRDEILKHFVFATGLVNDRNRRLFVNYTDRIAAEYSGKQLPTDPMADFLRPLVTTRVPNPFITLICKMALDLLDDPSLIQDFQTYLMSDRAQMVLRRDPNKISPQTMITLWSGWYETRKQRVA